MGVLRAYHSIMDALQSSLITRSPVRQFNSLCGINSSSIDFMGQDKMSHKEGVVVKVHVEDVNLCRLPTARCRQVIIP